MADGRMQGTKPNPIDPGNKMAKIRFGKLGLVGFGVDALANFGMNRAQGMDVKDAAVKGLGQSVAWNLVGAYGNLMLLGGAAMAGGALYQAGRAKWDRTVAKNYSSGVLGGNYIDTKQALTMRQAAVQAIQESRINGRQVLGNEASFMHRGGY
jgi:hypothetical protein